MDLEELRTAYDAACQSDDYPAQQRLLETITSSYPDEEWAWYDLGLRLKWTRDWPGSFAANLRAFGMLEDAEQSPEAWNLGIAATALGHWATARRAWTAFGIQLPDGDPNAPIQADFGLTPVRLNPDPRFAETPLTFGGVRHSTEVVWSRRLCPTRARIVNVPMPESGHRFGDVVLHDGDPVGTRRIGDSERSVFNEITVLERGRWDTLSVVVDAVGQEALDDLDARFDQCGFAIEPWTTSVRTLCRACSEGDAGGAHNHPADATDDDTLTLGIAAPLDASEGLLDAWLGEHGLRRGPVMV